MNEFDSLSVFEIYETYYMRPPVLNYYDWQYYYDNLGMQWFDDNQLYIPRDWYNYYVFHKIQVFYKYPPCGFFCALSRMNEVDPGIANIYSVKAITFLTHEIIWSDEKLIVFDRVFPPIPRSIYNPFGYSSILDWYSQDRYSIFPPKSW